MSHGYSQFGEHLDIEEVVGTMPHGYACDVGAWNGVELSNTLQLEEAGWDVLCVEANPIIAGPLTLARKLVKMVACGKGNSDSQPFTVYEVGQPGNYSAISALHPDENRPVHRDIDPKFVFSVPVRTLDWLLDHVKFPRLDVLTIDVEGGESDVLDGFDIARWQPKVIVLEDWYGGTHVDRMKSAGYIRMAKREINEVFIRA